MQRTAQVWLVYTITRSPLLVGLLGVCQFLPMLLFTLFAGVFVDRFSKKKILLATQSVFMTLGFLTTILVYLHVIQYWQILLIATLFGLSQTFDMPARQSFFAELVGKKDVMNSISLNSTIFNLAKIIGPAISGIVMERYGIVFCFLIDACSYIAVIIGLCLIKPGTVPPRKPRRHVVSEIREGLGYIRRRETLVLNVLLMAVVCTFAFNNDVIVPVFAKTVLGQGASMYTNLMSAAGIGALAGAIVMATIARYGIRKDLFVIYGVATSCIQVLMVFARNAQLALVLVAAIGFLNMSFLNLCNSIFQINTESRYRGRVMSVYAFLNQGSTPIGNLFSGAVMDRLGGISGFPACGAVSLLLLIPVFLHKRQAIKLWLTKGGE